MLVNGKHYRTVWFEKGLVRMIDQPLLPHKFEIVDLKNYMEVSHAIKTMVVRGAPAIGATAAYGLAQAALQAPESDFEGFVKKAAESLRSTRPTARDLFTGIEFVMNAIGNSSGVKESRESAINAAEDYANKSVEACKTIGKFGSELIKDGMKILTHCNAGWLACVDWGTALSPMYFAKRQEKKFFVFVDETRPRLQGARLTSWELGQEGIDHRIIADNAAGYYMRKGEIDLVIVGCDRLAYNGDCVNKIGTYEKAVLAKENEIPFYVALPTSTFDFKCRSGDEVVIEERYPDEVLYAFGLNDEGNLERVRISPKGSKALNPSFDTTPAELITNIITERGIVKPEEVKELKEGSK